MKRLRWEYKTQTIRYYMCGEYGENLQRPHYHACLFGIDFPDKELIKETEGNLLYSSDILENIWTHGFCSISEFSFETAAYVARYITKKITGEKAEHHYNQIHPITGEAIQLEPEYNNMSRRPGIAQDWYTKYIKDIYPSDFLIHKGNKISVPRYYDKLYEFDGNDIESIKLQRKVKARKNRKNNSPERLAVREKIQHLRFKQLNRSYETS